ncbi:hypothetical protein CTI14_45320, partial [Methylobacterium radiotolerans]
MTDALRIEAFLEHVRAGHGATEVERDLVTLTGTFEEILSAENIAAHADAWVCAVYTDAVPQTEPMRRLREAYPNCAMVQHQPAATGEERERSYGERLRAA